MGKINLLMNLILTLALGIEVRVGKIRLDEDFVFVMTASFIV